MEELKEKIIELLDELVSDLSQEDYLDLLNDLISDLEIRAESVQDELDPE